MEAVTNILVLVLGIYALIGVLFAIVFVVRLIKKVDPGSVGAHWSFRPMIFPGVVAFWPVLLKKWLNSRSNGS